MLKRFYFIFIFFSSRHTHSLAVAVSAWPEEQKVWTVTKGEKSFIKHLGRLDTSQAQPAEFLHISNITAVS